MSNIDKMEEDELDQQQDDLLQNADGVTKYKAAADVSNRVLAEIVKQCQPGKSILELCAFGDKLIVEGVANSFKTGKVEKGIAFPTCISVNNCLGHFSPLNGDATVLKEGDVAKIDLAAHIDGFIASVAHTVVVTANTAQPVTGRVADVICAAHYAAEAAHRLIKPGKKNTEVTEIIGKIAEQFGCQPCEGVLSHQIKRFIIDGNNVIINKATLDQKVDEFEFEAGQAYAVDIVMSTGEGKARETETRTTVFKRAVDQNYLLKLKAARYVLNEINQHFPTLPFTLRALDEKKGRLGITECVSHGLVVPYPVLFERPEAVVAQFKFTVLLMPSGTLRITSHALPYVQSEKKIEDASINAVLAMGTKRNKPKKKKAAASGSTPAANKDDAMDTA